MSDTTKLNDALAILKALGLPRAQQNERSALCLLALCDIRPDTSWQDAGTPLLGITPIMDWARDQYGKNYAPNTRETVRRQTMHQFVAAGLVLYNPDAPDRPVNSPKAVYQIAPEALALIRLYGSAQWEAKLRYYVNHREGLAQRYAQERQMRLVPVSLPEGAELSLSPGAHSELIKAIVEEFATRFAPGSRLVYVGDTGDKWGYFDQPLLAELGVAVDAHGKMPDVVLYDTERNWLLLMESVASHGPMDAKRHEELAALFKDAKPGIVYVTAFPTRTVMARHLGDIAWETEVWVADAPSRLIHFDGERFLGPLCHETNS